MANVSTKLSKIGEGITEIGKTIIAKFGRHLQKLKKNSIKQC